MTPSDQCTRIASRCVLLTDEQRARVLDRVDEMLRYNAAEKVRRAARAMAPTMTDMGTTADAAARLRCSCTTGSACAFCTTYGGFETP